MKLIQSFFDLISKSDGSATFRGTSTTASIGTTFTGTISSSATFPSGQVIKNSFYTITEASFSNATFGDDDTTPQRSEGVEIWSQSYTPSATATDLYIRAHVKLGETGSELNEMACGLFISDNNNALVVFQGYEESDAEADRVNNNEYLVNYLDVFIDHKMSSWGASAKTLSLRSSGAEAYNGFEKYGTVSSMSYYNNTITSGVVIQEVS